MAAKSTSTRRVAAPPSAVPSEFRRRTTRSRRAAPWINLAIWGGAFGVVLLLALLATELSQGVDAPAEVIVAAEAPVVPAVVPPPLPVIRLSRGRPEPALTAGGAGTTAVPPPAAASFENPFNAAAWSAEPTEIDRLVVQRLDQLKIKPAQSCSDAVFLRRVYLDVIGTLPTAVEARAFLDDEAPDKRSRLIDDLLERPEFADYQAMRWCDVLRVKAEFPVNLWPNAAQAYHRWIRTSIRDNRPYDEFARELLTASGSNFRTPQVNFYRAMQSKDSETIARTAALTFFCERAEHWPPGTLQSFAPLFAQVGYKPTGEWKEEIVLFDPRKVKRDSELGPLTAVLPDGTSVTLLDRQDPRLQFADWLIDGDNPRFVLPIANRVWTWLLGRGIVDPPDDFRADNPAKNPELLAYLGRELVVSGYDLKHLYRLILNSATYQRSCVPVDTGATQSAAEFASYPLRRLDAEVLIDAICQITGTTETYSSMIPEPFTFLPDSQRAIALPDGSITSSFLEMFGRPTRDTGLESERINRLTAAQALHLLNSNHIRQKIERGPGVQGLVKAMVSPDLIVDELYLAILSRLPTADERYALMWNGDSDTNFNTIVWALINSEEFLFRH